MDPETIIEKMLIEISNALLAMSKANSADEKLQYSRIVRNLSDSFSMIVDVSTAFDDDDDDDDDEDEDEEF